MQKFNRCEVDSFTYEKLKEIQISNGTSIREQQIGSRKKLFSYDLLIATTANNAQLELNGLSQRKFNSFLGMFNRTLYNQFYKKPELHDLKIKYKGLAREKNFKVWQTLKEDDFFYNIDLSSAYWQIAHSLGYISDKVFENYMNLDDYKSLKRYCVSFLARKNKMRYISVDGEFYEIECDTRIFQQVYDNIRSELYKTIENVRKTCENYLEYNIDGITVLSDDLHKVKHEMKKMGLHYKITECIKLNENEYISGSKVKRFKNK